MGDVNADRFWLYRDKKGQIQGPLDTLSVVRLIKLGRIKEDDQVLSYPDGTWVVLSRIPEFYDAVIDVLSGKVSLSDITEQTTDKREDISSAEKLSPTTKDDTDLESPDWTQFETPKKDAPARPGKVVLEGKVSKAEAKPGTAKKVTENRPAGGAAPQSSSSSSKSRGSRPKVSGNFTRDGETIDLSNEDDLVASRKKNSRLAFVISAGVILASAAGYFTFFSAEMPKGAVHLLLPRKNRPAHADANARIQKAASQFEHDTFDGYTEAENILVEVVEGAPQNSDALALLCLSYRELWPYAFQDSQDLSVVSQVTQLASAADAFGTKGSICRVTQQLIAGQFESAQGSLKTLLTQSPDTPFFYEMKAQLLGDARDYQTAIAFIQKTNQIFPAWIKPLVVEARLHYKLGQYAEARKLYQTVLHLVRDHPVAQIELGNLEYHEFKKEREGAQWVQAGLEAGKTPNNIRSLGLQTLAQYAMANGNKTKATNYAIESYKADPTNLDVRELIQQLGAQNQLKGLQTDCQEIIRVGEQYAKSENWLAAQAEFRTAFDTCSPKNAFAAYRAAETLWSLHQSLDAAQWMQKAINTDPQMIEAYAHLASYYAERFEFEKAYQVLQQGNQVRPHAAELLRGYAMVELKRNNPKDAIRYGEESLKIYDNDIETNLTLVQAYQLDRQYEKAYQVASRAIELDKNNTKAQGLYAEAYAGFQGVNAAASYVKSLINTYPNIVDYRVTLARIYKKDDRYQDMVEVLIQALNMDPNNKEARLLIGQAYASLDQTRPALDAFLTVVTLDPTDIYPVILIGNLYLEKGDFPGALQNYERARDLNPKYPRVNYLIGQSAFGAHDYARALLEAQKEELANPNVADSYILAGQSYMQLALQDAGGGKGLYSKAVEQLQHALKLKQQKAPVYILLARAQRLSHNFDVALTMLRMAAGTESGNPDLYKERGAVYEMKNQNAEAVEAYKEYLQLSPGAPDAKLIQATIQRLGS